MTPVQASCRGIGPNLSAPTVLPAAMLLIALSGPSAHVSAQAVAPDTLVLTLGNAYEIASLSNPAYRQALNSVTLNGPETRAVWSDQILPSLSLNLLSTSYDGRLTPKAQDFFGNPIENPESDFAYSSSTGQSLTFTWSLQGANLLNYDRRQRLTNRGRELASDAAMVDLRTDVRRQFFAVLREQELLEAERSLVAARRVDLKVAEQLFRLAERTRVDVLNAELGIEQQNLDVNRQERRYEQAVLALRTILGDEALPAIRLVPEAEDIFDPAGIEVDVLIDRAMNANAEILRRRASVESAAHGVREQKAGWWPRLDANYSLGRFAQTRGGGAFFDLKSDDDVQSSFAVRLSVPFFNDFFRNRANIAQAAVDLDNADEDLRSARLDVAEQVRSAALALRNEFESYQLAQRSLAIADEALSLAREEYRFGTRTFEQLRESVDSEAEARRQVIEARYGFLGGLVTLEEAAGTRVAGSSADPAGN